MIYTNEAPSIELSHIWRNQKQNVVPPAMDSSDTELEEESEK